MPSNKEGQSFVFFVPPSWILVGTVATETQEEYTLKHAVYVEAVKQGHSAWDLSETSKAAETAWPLPEGTVLRKEAILIAGPTSNDIAKELNRGRDRQTLKGAR